MSLISLGINHKTAPVSVREKAAFAEHELAQAMADLQSWLNQELSISLQKPSEVAIISTCNRVEFYINATGCEPEIVMEQTKSWLQNYNQLEEKLDSYLYLHSNLAAVGHIMRVASGLDSMVLGEPQILGQLKAVYQKAKRAGTLGVDIERLFQKAFSAAKKVRHDTDIGTNPVSVAFAAVNLAKHIFADFSELTVLFVGAGETIELAARHLQQQTVGQMLMANRTLANAQKLAQEFSGQAIGLEAIPHFFSQADIVISSTGSMLPIIGKGMVEEALKKRRRKSIFMVDLAVPRDIEASVADLDDVYLYTVDDLEGVIQDNMQARQEAATQAEAIILPFVESYWHWLENQKKHDTVRDLQKKYQQIATQELQRAKAQLQNDAQAEDALEALAHRLLKKFMHQPLVWLRQESNSESTVEIEQDDLLREIFKLDDD
ncbi:glutamyl-tRNA reductase [Kangiella sp. HZ709]|uniref:glutamyl-tRNA reductase n=1 Tax=Kangiella sp. HZ709 TaxID=2666328 RepID=UPI0012B139C2|nr:glutamyl-tRNA reductase [Kangiella sp. HZ709]MRX27489.1 glutamyl-tRNA reductase [Kangiella sp. HZ709]